MGKAGQHSSTLRDTGLFRSKTSERMLLKSKGVGKRRPQGHCKGLTNLGLAGAQHQEGGVCNQLQKWSLGFHLLSEVQTQQHCVCLYTGGKPALRNSSSRSRAVQHGRGRQQCRSALIQLFLSHPLPTDPTHKGGSRKFHCHFNRRD